MRWLSWRGYHQPLFNKSFESTVGQGSDTYSRIYWEAGTTPQGQFWSINKSNEKEMVVGRINKTHILNGSNWIMMLLYKGVDEYDTQCGREQRSAVVMISCNGHTLVDNFNPMFEERGKVQDCLYLLL